jgi:hypothetical protein
MFSNCCSRCFGGRRTIEYSSRQTDAGGRLAPPVGEGDRSASVNLNSPVVSQPLPGSVSSSWVSFHEGSVRGQMDGHDSALSRTGLDSPISNGHSHASSASIDSPPGLPADSPPALPAADPPQPDMATVTQWVAEGNVSSLVTSGITINMIREDDCALLRLAAENNHVHVLDWLITNFSLTSDDFRAGNNAILRSAVSQNHVDIMAMLKEHGGLTLQDIRTNKNEALKTAVTNGDLDMVKRLHAYGLAVSDARSVLEVAITHFNEDILNFLK